MNINLLPWREIRQREQRKKMLARIFIYFLLIYILSIAVKFILYFNARDLKSKINTIQANTNAIKLSDPLKKNDLLLKRLALFKQQKQTGIDQNTYFQQSLLSIANTIPNSIVLSKIALKPTESSLTGHTNQISDIHQYVNLLQQKMPKHFVQLSNVQTDSKNANFMQFTIDIKIKALKKT